MESLRLDKESGLNLQLEVPALGQAVYGKLEHMIVSRAIPPGTRLIETDLAQSFGVSRGPVRAALQQLAQNGFVELRQRQTAFVRVPTLREIDDFYDIRCALEGESARLAAARITPEGALRLRKCIKASFAMLARNQEKDENVPNMHSVVASIASNKELTRLLEMLNKRSSWYTAPYEQARRKLSLDEHKPIVAAICDGDPVRAAEAMRAHIDATRRRFKAHAQAM